MEEFDTHEEDLISTYVNSGYTVARDPKVFNELYWELEQSNPQLAKAFLWGQELYEHEKSQEQVKSFQRLRERGRDRDRGRGRDR